MSKKFTVRDLRQYVESIQWPAEREEIVRTISMTNASEDLIVGLSRLQDGVYNSPEEIMQSLSGVWDFENMTFPSGPGPTVAIDPQADVQQPDTYGDHWAKATKEAQSGDDTPE